MNYAKLINNYPVFAQNPILHDGNYIGNPPGSVYEAEGYKPVQFNEQPTEPGDGYQWVETWGETETEIVQDWVLVEVPISEEDALVRYANELTVAEDETLTEATETLIKKLKEGN
jgi:hypothetical protein